MSSCQTILTDFDLFPKNENEYFVASFGEVYGWSLV